MLGPKALLFGSLEHRAIYSCLYNRNATQTVTGTLEAHMRGATQGCGCRLEGLNSLKGGVIRGIEKGSIKRIIKDY